MQLARLAVFAVACPFLPIASAQTAPQPDVRVGDRWQFAVWYEVPSSQPSRDWIVTALDGDTILGTENGEPLRLTASLGVSESPRDRSSNPRTLVFPLSVGQRWHYANMWTFKPKGSSGQVDVEAEVLAYEKVRVPAGEFDAFHVRAVERVSGNSPINSVYAGEIVRNYWYAPAARAIVRLASRNPYLGPSTVELVAFELR